jgi:hypothetical protein
MMSTKSGAWEAKPVGGITFSLPTFSAIKTAWFVQPIQTTDGAAYPWGIEMGEGDGWEPTNLRHEDFASHYGLRAVHVLYPASLPTQLAIPRDGGRARHVAEGTWSDVETITVVQGATIKREETIWQAMLDGTAPLDVPPHTRRQVIIDLNDYICPGRWWHEATV